MEDYEIVTTQDVWDKLSAQTKKEREEWALGLSSAIWCQFLCTMPIVTTFPGVLALEHGPRGCMSNADTFFLPYLGQYWGQPTHVPKLSTGLGEQDVVMGGEEKLEEAIRQADRQYNPELIVVTSCCATGIMGEDIQGLVDRMRGEINADITYLESPGFSNILMGQATERVIRGLAFDLMEAPAKKNKDSVNLLGLYKDTYAPPGASKAPNEISEYGRYIEALGLKINSVIWGSAGGLQHIKRAPEAEFNAGTCVTWHIPLAEMMEERFGIPYSPHGQCLGIEINRKWLMAVAQHFGREDRAMEFFNREFAPIRDDFERAKELCHGKVALLDGGRNTMSAVARTLMHARFALELGMEPVIFNLHPLEVLAKPHDTLYFLREGVNSKMVWYNYPFGKSVNPLTLMERLGVGPEDCMYIHSDIFHYAMASGESFDATGVFDASIIPSINASSHIRRCRSGPHRTYGLRGTHRLLQELLEGASVTRAGAHPTFESRLSRVARS